ncbi:hypothetical protein [Mycolicibacterium vaccae]|uniref:hypothetical protein n=1 Tax=Mycolicibacterium vaccae TaxID=1810 RepID=UPI003CFC5474
MAPAAHGDIRSAHSRGPNRGTPYRLVVVGTDAAEVVSAAGGLIYDAVSIGWHVDVHLDHHEDARALRIVGTRSQPLPMLAELDSDCPDMVFLGAALLERHPPILRLATSLTRNQLSDVAVWGTDALPPQLGMSACLDYRLSNAAAVFKRQAMAVAGRAGKDSAVETFRRGRPPMSAVPPFDSSAHSSI